MVIDQTQRNDFIKRVHDAIEAEHREWKTRGRLSYAERQELARGRIAVEDECLAAYRGGLPRVPMSRCPFCEQLLVRCFDPWGLDGFWWQHQRRGNLDEPPACEHFRVLTGALSLGAQPARGGDEESRPGPDVPYVIPAVLEQPTMVAVVMRLAMQNGYTAYPIAYFSTDQPRRVLLSPTWGEVTANGIGENGRGVWGIPDDPWDFDLSAWTGSGKLRWIDPDSKETRLSSQPASACPFVDLPGERKNQMIRAERHYFIRQPYAERLAPFSG